MLCLGDISELFDQCDTSSAVQVVKNPIRFEWPSVMLFDNSRCENLTLEYIENQQPQAFEWGLVGELTTDWNHLVGYDEPRRDAKLVHFTQGIPCFEETMDCEYSKEWNQELDDANGTVPWESIMGDSVHKEPVLRRLNEQRVEVCIN